MILRKKNADSPRELSHDDCFDILSNHRRRFLLHYLEYHDGAANIGEPAQQIAAWENNISAEEVTYEERKRVYTSLQQVHLPRMDEMGVVEFDNQSGNVQYGPAAEEVDVYIEIVRGNDILWGAFYFRLAVLNLGIILTVRFSDMTLSISSGFWLAFFSITMFLIASLAHIYISRKEIQLGNNLEPPEIS